MAMRTDSSSPDGQLIYGRPFTSTRVLGPSWITWIDFSSVHPAKLTSSTARALSRGISYHERARRKTHQGFLKKAPNTTACGYVGYGCADFSVIVCSDLSCRDN